MGSKPGEKKQLPKPNEIKPKKANKNPTGSAKAARDKKFAIAVFIFDGILLSAAAVLFVSQPSCGGGVGDDNYGYGDAQADYDFSGGNASLQFHGHQPPMFNQFYPSPGSSSYSSSYGYGYSPYGSSSYGSPYGSSSSYGPSNYGSASTYGYGSSSPYGSSYVSSYGSGYGSSSTSGSSYGSSSGSSYGPSTPTSIFGYLPGSGYSPGSTSGSGYSTGSTSGSGYVTGSTSGSGYGTATTGSGYGTGPTSGSGYGTGSTGYGYGTGSTGSGYGTGSTGSGYGTGSTGFGYGAGSTGSGSGTGSTGSVYGTGSTGSGYVTGSTSGSGHGSTGTGSGVGSHFESGTSSQISGINTGSGNGFFGGVSPPSGGSSSGGSTVDYPYGDIVDVIPDDMFSTKNYECGVSEVQPNLGLGRIVGGNEAVKHSWPFTVSIVTVSPTQPNAVTRFCGGTIVTPRHVISAFHCFPDEDYYHETYRVVVGKHDEDTTPGTQYVISKIRAHPESYVKREIVFDLAILTLKKDIQFNKLAQPACLPKPDAIVPSGTWCWAVGWGKTKGTGAEGKLKQVKVQVKSEEECKKTHSEGTATENMVWSLSKEFVICAGGVPGQDTCQGDSGGPLFCQDDGKWTLYGATSWGTGCGTGIPGAYASVSYSTEWICCYMADIPGCQQVDCDPWVLQ